MTNPQILEFIAKELRQGKPPKEVASLLRQMGLSDGAINNAMEAIINPLRQDVFHESNPAPTKADIITARAQEVKRVQLERIDPFKRKIEVTDFDPKKIIVPSEKKEFSSAIPYEDYYQQPSAGKFFAIKRLLSNIAIGAIFAFVTCIILALAYFALTPTL